MIESSLQATDLRVHRASTCSRAIKRPSHDVQDNMESTLPFSAAKNLNESRLSQHVSVHIRELVPRAKTSYCRTTGSVLTDQCVSELINHDTCRRRQTGKQSAFRRYSVGRIVITWTDVELDLNVATSSAEKAWQSCYPDQTFSYGLISQPIP